MNPFGTAMPINSMKDLLYRDSVISKLENCINNKQQTVILGVEGVGKSSLLQSFFCRQYRIKKASEENILISPVTEFPTDHNADSCFLHFTKMVINAVKILDSCGKEDLKKKILDKYENCKKEAENAQDLFEKTMEVIGENEYRIVMVIDNFERFTSSRNITKDHHEILLKLLDYSQYIVATNYDLNEDSLPDDVSASLFLTRFARNQIELKGWSRSESEEFVKSKLECNNIQFSQKLLDSIYNISGGIPTLLSLSAQFAYEYIEKHRTEEGLMFNPSLYSQRIVQKLLSHWCRIITPGQMIALRALFKGEKEDRDNLCALFSRGLLKHKTKTDSYGREIIDDLEYDFCCKLLGTFCSDGDKLEDAMEENPLRDFHDTKESLRRKILRIPFEPDKPYIFVSYSHKNDLDVYEDVYRLKTQYNCWIDFENLDGGRTLDEDDWTEKVRPVLESDLCVGVILYLSPEAMNSDGTMLEAEWIMQTKHQFYTVLLNFRDNITKREMAKFISENIIDTDPEIHLRRQFAFSYVGYATTGFATETYHHRSKTFTHLHETDFTNWTKRIFLI